MANRPPHFDYKTKAIAQKKCQDFLYEWFNEGGDFGRYDEHDKKYDWYGGYGGGSEPEVGDVTIGEACRHWAWNSVKNTKKRYNTEYGIGQSRYLVNYHDGKKTHDDGSPFYDMAIFKNKVKLNKFIKDLKDSGYREGR